MTGTVMQRVAIRLLALLAGLLLLAGALPARADTPVTLFQSLRGNLNFTGTEETQRNKDDSKSCSVSNPNKKLSAYLGGIPSGATIKSAQLYWAGSGLTPDYTVSLDGVSVTATAKRQYVAKSGSSGATLSYFSGAADVTSRVANKGNGYYAFSDLTVENGDPWCSAHAVLAGFALVVVYSHPDEPFRMLNLYEGFQAFQNNSLTIDLGNFSVPNPLPAKVTGRVGHITWEGDALLSQGGEDLLFNGVQMSDALNPPGNQFNSASNITGDTRSYGIDFDAYTLASPVIQPGQNGATTTYRSGQDMVLLGAEIVAMPYVANADLALSMSRSGELTVGSPTSYTLSVSNGGLDDELGPVTVVDTLPAGLTLVSAGGTGWTCANAQSNGQTVVACTQAGPLKPGDRMTPLVISVTPTAAASYTNTATVTGKTGDSKLSNNTATDTGTAVDRGSAAFVLTSEACTDGQPIVTPLESAGCHRFIGPVVAAAKNTGIYITAVKSGQVASKMQDTDYPLSFDLKFSCLPNSKVPIGYAGRSDFDCAGSTRTVSAKLPGGQPSAVLDTGNPLSPFYFADVGRVSITLSYKGAVVGTVDFISRPLDVRFANVQRVADGFPDQNGSRADSPSWFKPDIGFARAGEQFLMRLGAVMADGNWAPSFGQEAAALKAVLPADSLAFDFALDTFAVSQLGTTRAPVPGKDAVVRDAFILDQKFIPSPAYANMVEATARYFEAGLLGITPRLVDYLNTGQVPLDATRMLDGTRIVGRFYPDHFVTRLTPPLGCATSMNCPAAAGQALRGAAYSTQPFGFSVEVYGLPKTAGGDPTLLYLYQNVKGDGSTPGPLRLQASKAPNLVAAPALDAQPPAAGAFAADPASLLAAPSAQTPFPGLAGTVNYRLGERFSPAVRAAGNWGAPTPVYLRALLNEQRGALAAGKLAPVADPVSTVAPAGAPAATQYEDGLMIVSGRLFVPNVFGSELLRLPVPLAAQYWNGSAWLTSSGDEDSLVASSINALACRKFFALDLTSGACKPSPLAAAGAVPVRLTHGKASLALQAPPRGTVGSVDYTLDSADAPWLPSTQARATFGLYKSPLIYLREVY